MSLTAIENLLKMRTKSKKRTRTYNRIRIQNVSRSMSLADLEARIEAMAEEEEAMTRYEHGQEVG